MKEWRKGRKEEWKKRGEKSNEEEMRNGRGKDCEGRKE